MIRLVACVNDFYSLALESPSLNDLLIHSYYYSAEEFMKAKCLNHLPLPIFHLNTTPY